MAVAESVMRRRPEALFEFRCLASLLVVVVAILGFVEFGNEVIEGDTSAFDRDLLLALRNPTNAAQLIGPPWLEPAAVDITALGGTTVLTFMTITIAGYLLMARRHAAALQVAVSIGGGALLSSLLKMAFDRPRPDLVPHAVAVASASFPSGHAMLSAVAYLTIGGLLMRVQTRLATKVYVLTTAVLLTVLIGISRIYLGVHWPTDVLAGWCIGAAWALLCWVVATSSVRHGDQVENERQSR
jgi:undecaprenyl-diphosphatase